MIHECRWPTHQLNIGNGVTVDGEETSRLGAVGRKRAATSLLPQRHVFWAGQLQQSVESFVAQTIGVIV